MIFGIGIDMVEIRRIEDGLARFGTRFAQRILSEAEFCEYNGHPRPAQFLARRFAAKEALVKAVGTGFRHGLFPREISVQHDTLGKPELRFSSQARSRLDQIGVSNSYLSISDERDYALAYVLLEKK
ncbi:MAG: holo-ACP synthase [Gammaproteobacteria bacterium]|nr:holo-ACP synthase [Gammaproteobacteria bacterium]